MKSLDKLAPNTELQKVEYEWVFVSTREIKAFD